MLRRGSSNRYSNGQKGLLFLPHFSQRSLEKSGSQLSLYPTLSTKVGSNRPRNLLRPTAICTRNLGPDYGIEVVIEAFAIVLQHHPSAKLYLIGDGPLRNKLESLVQGLGLSGHVQFCGAMPNEKVAEWYERADIFVNASFLDNSPLSILEAMSSGAPVVTTAAGGISSMVRHEGTGLLCPVGNAQALAEQVIRLLREPELARNIAHRAHHELAAHRWVSVRQKWLEVYG